MQVAAGRPIFSCSLSFVEHVPTRQRRQKAEWLAVERRAWPGVGRQTVADVAGEGLESGRQGLWGKPGGDSLGGFRSNNGQSRHDSHWIAPTRSSSKASDDADWLAHPGY